LGGTIMALPGLVRANNLNDVVDREKVWDNLGLNISADFTIPSSFEVEAAQYIAAVEAADGQVLEQSIRFAINNFVVGCKTDGIWIAMKASCILAGARTRLGALTPLTGTAPISFNFVDSDYNRKTGLKGNGTTKYLDSNRSGSEDPQDSRHLYTYRTASETQNATRIAAGAGNSGNATGMGVSNTTVFWQSASVASSFVINNSEIGSFGVSRSSGTEMSYIRGTLLGSFSRNSGNPVAENYFIYARSVTGTSAPNAHSDARQAFYSIGESLDLVLLGARVTTLITAIGAAIP
jgi:hypothetical protein